jgi:hypothetical protein
LGAQFVNAKNAVIDVIFGATARWTEFVNRRSGVPSPQRKPHK